MRNSRRNILQLLGTGLMAGLAGCSSFTFGGKQEYAPLVMQNSHDAPHMMSVAITTIPDGGGGFTEYLTDTWLVSSGDEHTFEEGLAFTDYEPELMVLVVLDDETAKKAEFSFDFDLSELRILITENGQIAVQPQK